MPPTRRQFLVAAGAIAVAAALGCGGSDDSEETDTISEEEAESDVALLNTLLELEFTAVAAYAAAGEVLSADIGRFAEHEQAHADELARAVRRLGGIPIGARPDDEYAAGFPSLPDETAALEFLVDVENTSVAAYLDGLPKIQTPELRATATAIVTTEAEQMAVLLGELGLPQTPDAFVTGS